MNNPEDQTEALASPSEMRDAILRAAAEIDAARHCASVAWLSDETLRLVRADLAKASFLLGHALGVTMREIPSNSSAT